eukprot:CAMPEP_0177583122 /NCGR_PEP_ID=MMETSP0419_2-20121207/3146_1 /TAXON_ID=582737 /ORGANISM="Tetraselmis sp., Strain GSL018" /LENGTH=390 /DNA_ID=CAMNT_0019072477 /DNA_START=332 /DNA_END=1500 /DNA_ORIENTATION=-
MASATSEDEKALALNSGLEALRELYKQLRLERSTVRAEGQYGTDVEHTVCHEDNAPFEEGASVGCRLSVSNRGTRKVKLLDVEWLSADSSGERVGQGSLSSKRLPTLALQPGDRLDFAAQGAAPGPPGHSVGEGDHAGGEAGTAAEPGRPLRRAARPGAPPAARPAEPPVTAAALSPGAQPAGTLSSQPPARRLAQQPFPKGRPFLCFSLPSPPSWDQGTDGRLPRGELQRACSCERPPPPGCERRSHNSPSRPRRIEVEVVPVEEALHHPRVVDLARAVGVVDREDDHELVFAHLYAKALHHQPELREPHPAGLPLVVHLEQPPQLEGVGVGGDVDLRLEAVAHGPEDHLQVVLAHARGALRVEGLEPLGVSAAEHVAGRGVDRSVGVW